MYLATTSQMKEMDRIAIEELGIPSLELMENAAQKVAREVHLRLSRDKREKLGSACSVGVILSAKEELTPEQKREAEEVHTIVEGKNTDPAQRIAIFCGPGNNGGDGIAAARLLREMGYSVRAFLVGDRGKMTPDARAMEEKLAVFGGVLETFLPDDSAQRAWLMTADAVVDAIFGVGLKRPLQGDFLAAVQWINHLSSPFRPVFACDLPSGVDGDTGEVLGEAVRADVTITFTCGKPGLYMGEGRACSGEIRVVKIGIPSELEYKMVDRRNEGVQAMDGGHYVLPRRRRTAHKGDFGRVFVLAGSEGYTGAPVLAANAAVRTGAGLVFLGVPRNIYPIVAVKCDEAMPFPLPERYEAILEKARGCDIALIGPGLGRAPETEELVRRLLGDLEIPVVLDADGINALAGHIDILDKRSALTVLTPHEGEFHRLTGCELPVRDRLTAARDFAKAHRCVLVLKGHGTVTAAPEGRAWICGAGNPGMAKGGSGDVLGGMILSLLGQGIPPRRAVPAAVYLHGRAGDLAARDLGQAGMTPADMIKQIPFTLK